MQKNYSFVIFSVMLLWAPITAAHEVDLSTLPLRDGDISTSPKVGSVYACQARFNTSAPGAQKAGDWIKEDEGVFDLTKKPVVDGAVTHLSEMEIVSEDGRRRISGNALPNHPTGVFPIARTDDAFQYDRNPNSIRERRYVIDLPADPFFADEPSCAPMGPIGIMMSGAVLFNALDARGDNALAHEMLDACQGHPQQDGLYHYHGKSPCVEDSDSAAHSGLIGYAFDGFGIYGFRDEDGHILTSDELDECHGHVGPVPESGDGLPVYHYHATPDYPYTVSCFMGAPTSVPELSGRGRPRR